MGYTLRAALDVLGPGATVEVAELVPAVAEWNRGALGDLAGHPLRDQRTQLHLDDVHSRITAGRSTYDVILLDVDNSPAALAHPTNAALYSRRGLAEAWAALKPTGSLGVWSFANDRRFTDRLEQQGFADVDWSAHEDPRMSRPRKIGIGVAFGCRGVPHLWGGCCGGCAGLAYRRASR